MSSSDVGAVIVDFLSFTFDVDVDSREGLVRYFHGAVSDRSSMYQPTYDMRQYGYRHGFQFAINCTTQKTCKVYYDPWRDNCSFVRCVYNPSQVDNSGQEDIEDTLLVLTHHFCEYSLDSLRITRLDVAIDILDAYIHRLLATVPRHPQTRPRLQKSCLYCSPTGTTQTLYIGDKNSELHYCIYDKNRNQHLPRGHEEPIVTRFEARIKHTLYPSQLAALQNPLAGLDVIDFPRLEDSAAQDELAPWFLDSCRHRGLHAALRLCRNSRERIRYRRLIHEAGTAAWWNPEESWNVGWVDAVNPILRVFHEEEVSTMRRRRRRRRRRRPTVETPITDRPS